MIALRLAIAGLRGALLADAAPFRAIVIEDDADACANLADILELDGFDVRSAGSAHEAMALDDWGRTSVVILDRNLPDGNALGLLPRFREMAPQAAIIIITGLADLDGVITALRFGASDYILKPIHADALRASLTRIVNRLETERALKESQNLVELERGKALQNERLAAIGETMTGLIHESRNALQRSKACLEMLSLEVHDRPAALELVSRVQRAQEDLHRLYEEVRQYAAPVILRKERCDLRTLWRNEWQNISFLREHKRLRLEEDIRTGDVFCRVDPFAIQQVWRNILENAIVVAPDDTAILISAWAVKIEGQAALAVTISDRGPGLTSEQSERIFEPFFTTKAKGTGLGMAIAQRIVTAHGGTISATNAAPGGAIIEIILPQETT